MEEEEVLVSERKSEAGLGAPSVGEARWIHAAGQLEYKGAGLETCFRLVRLDSPSEKETSADFQ